MKRLLIIILMLASVSLNAQNWPIDPTTKEINFTSVVTIDSAAKNDLFVRANEWFAKTFNDSKEVIQMSDKESGKIVGKGIFKVYFHSFGTKDAGYVHYTISIMVKDGRYKYSLNDLYHSNEGATPGIGSGGNLINEKADCGNFNLTKKIFDEIKLQAYDQSMALVESLNTFMKTQSVSKLESW